MLSTLRARHEVARAVGQVEGRGERLEVCIEIAPHAVLDPLPGAESHEARAEPRQGVQGGQENDHDGVKAEGAAAPAEAVHRSLTCHGMPSEKPVASAKQPAPTP